MSIYYPASNCGGGAVPDYTCNPCPTYEYGRIRSIAFVKTSYVATLLADPTNSALWSTGMDSGDVVVIWKTQGSYNAPSTTELPGFGDEATVNGNTTHSLTYKDVSYADNCDFYNAIKNSTEYTAVYRTSSKIHFTEEPVTITPSNPVADDINSIVVWEVSLKWTNPDSPCPYDVPDNIFDVCAVNG